MKLSRPPDPGEASLPEGWASLSVQSRRELMPGTQLPGEEGIVGEPKGADAMMGHDPRSPHPCR
jgi:hypothetical protein